MARSDKKPRGDDDQKPEWHGGLEPPHFSEQETQRLSALQLCDAVAFRLRQLGVDASDLLRLRNRVEEIEDPVMQGVRYLDKLIDELAKGRPMEKILRKV